VATACAHVAQRQVAGARGPPRATGTCGELEGGRGLTQTIAAAATRGCVPGLAAVASAWTRRTLHGGAGLRWGLLPAAAASTRTRRRRPGGSLCGRFELPKAVGRVRSGERGFAGSYSSSSSGSFFFGEKKGGGCRTTGRQPEQAQAGSPSAGESPRLRTPSAFLPPTSNPHPGPAPAAQRGGGAHWQFLMLLVTPVTNSQFPPCHGAGLKSSSMCGGGARQPATAGAACDLVGAGLVRDTHWQHTELRHFSRRASCLPDPAQRDSRG